MLSSIAERVAGTNFLNRVTKFGQLVILLLHDVVGRIGRLLRQLAFQAAFLKPCVRSLQVLARLGELALQFLNAVRLGRFTRLRCLCWGLVSHGQAVSISSVG